MRNLASRDRMMMCICSASAASKPALIPIETDGIKPDHLATLSPSEIAALPVRHGNRMEKLGDFFHVEGDPSDLEIHIEGDCSRVTRLGAGMTGGALTIDGAAGPYAGAELRNGRIEIRGDAGDWLGAEMRGGQIHVHGSAGNRAGARLCRQSCAACAAARFSSTAVSVMSWDRPCGEGSSPWVAIAAISREQP